MDEKEDKTEKEKLEEEKAKIAKTEVNMLLEDIYWNLDALINDMDNMTEQEKERVSKLMDRFENEVDKLERKIKLSAL